MIVILLLENILHGIKKNFEAVFLVSHLYSEVARLLWNSCNNYIKDSFVRDVKNDINL
jgi:hypothetical protein